MKRSVEVLEAMPNPSGAWLVVVATSWSEYRPLLNDERLVHLDGRPGRYHVVNSTPHAVPMLVVYAEGDAEPPKKGDVLEVVEAA